MKFFSSTRYTPQQLQNIAIDLFCDVLGSILSAIGALGELFALQAL